MQEIINRVLSNNLADFEGLEISGAIPLRDAFLNEAIASFLTSLKEGGENEISPGAGAAGDSARPSVDTKALLQMVQKVEVQSEKGVVTVRFDVRR